MLQLCVEIGFPNRFLGVFQLFLLLLRPNRKEMRQKYLFIIVGIVLSLLFGTFLSDRQRSEQSCTELAAQWGNDACEFNPIGDNLPRDMEMNEVGIATTTFTYGMNAGRVLRLPTSLTHPTASLQQIKHVVRFIQRRVAVFLLHYHVTHSIDRSPSSSLYTYAIRHIII